MVKNLPAVERSTKIRFGKHVPDSTDQAENTIVFNASNTLVPTPNGNAVYLSPIRNRPDYTESQVVLLMYDKNTKEITESGESANALVGGATLALTVNRANVTSNTVQFVGRGNDFNGTSFVTDSNVGISNLLPQHTVSVGSNLYIDDTGSNVLVVSGNVAVLRDMIIEGNLTVNGDTTVIYTENTSIKDALIELGKDNTSADTTLDLGILMHRPDALSNVVIGYREGTSEFAIAYTDSKPTDKTLIPKTDEDINVHVYGLTHVDANIYAHEDIHVSGNVYVSQNVYAQKDLEVVGNVYVDGNVVAYKDFTLTGNAYVYGNVSVTEELTVSNNVYAQKDLEVVGNVYVDGNVVAYKDFTLTGNAYVSGNVTVDTNTFHVDAEANRVGLGTTTPGYPLDVRGAANVGTLTTTTGTVTNETHSTSKDTGVLVLTQGGLGVKANIHSTNVFAVSHITVGTSETSNTFDVRGTANVGALVATSTHISDTTAVSSKTTGALQVTGGVGIQGDIHATHANLEDVEADSVTVTDATAATDKITGALKVAGGVGIQGDLYATNGTFTTNVYITDHTDLNNKHLVMIDTNGSLIQSPVYVAPSGKYVISAAEAEFLGNITLGGNTTLLTSTSLVVEDRIIGIGSNNSAEGLDSGIIIEHQDGGAFANIALIHHADEHRFSIGYTQNTLSDNHILNASHPNNVTLRVDLIGNTIVQNSLSVSEMGTFGTMVGIATTEPIANIHVVGNAFVTSNITTSSNVLVMGDAAATSKTTGALQVAGGVGISGNVYADAAYISSNLNVDGTTLHVDSVSNKVGIGKTDPVFTLDVNGDINFSGGLNQGGSTFVSSPWTIAANDDLSYTSGNVTVDTTTFHVDTQTSNVGIGKTNPGFTLDVAGDVNFSGELYQGGSPFVSSPWTIAVNDDLSYTSGNVTVDTTTFHVDTQTSNVGIGKTNPGFTLDVVGDVNFSGSLYEDGTPFVSTPWTIDGNDLEYTSGNIGIGTNAANATLHVGGNIYSSSNISAYEIEVANVTTTNLMINTVIVSATLSLDSVVNVSNITSNTVQFTNPDVGLVATGNVVADYFKGNGSKLTGIATTLESVSNFGNTTSNVIQFTNPDVGLVATGNVVANYFKGNGSELTEIVTKLESVSNFGNTTSNVIQFTNPDVGLVATSNIHIGGIAKQTSVPAFTVRLTDGTVVGAGDIDYNQVDTDNTNSYTVVDGRFTAPVSGHYFFSAHGIYQNDVTVYDFTINGTRQNINALCSAPSANYIQCNISAVLNLSVGQYVTVYQVEGGTFGTDNNVFTGFFIG
jgi:cytoskeletal protein CcmA (bactofilin family)